MDHDSKQSFEVLDTRVRAAEREMHEIRSTMRTGFSELNQVISAQYSKFETLVNQQTSRFETQIDNQNSLIEKQREPKFQIYAVIIPIVLCAAGFVWAILQSQITGKLNSETYYIAAERAKESRATTDASIAKITDKMVPFDVHRIQWDANAAALSNLRESIVVLRADMQRQIDEVKRQQGDTYTARDVILRLETRQRELEDIIIRGRLPGQSSP